MVADPVDFILANTTPRPVGLVPEIIIRTADDAHDLWHKTEAELDELGLPPPFWAFPWAGGQALARIILDHPETVSGKRVIDFASGSGLVAIAAAKAGAATVKAVDIDPFSVRAINLNCALNDVRVDTLEADIIGTIPDADVVLAGDVFYDSSFSARVIPWFADLARRGIIVLAGDPLRRYGPGDQAEIIARHDVPSSLALEDAAIKQTVIYRFKRD